MEVIAWKMTKMISVTDNGQTASELQYILAVILMSALNKVPLA